MKDPQQNPVPQRSVQSYVLGAILILLFFAVCSILYPFFSALLWSILLYILLRPLHRRLTKGLNFRTIKGKFLRSLWAAGFTIGTLAIIFIPLFLMVSIFFRQIMDISGYVRDQLDQNPEYFHDLFEKISNLIRDATAGQVELSGSEIESQIREFLAAELQRIVQLGSGLAKNIGGFLLDIALIMFSMFFFFVDGPYLGMLVKNAIPIRKDYLAALIAKIMDTVRALFMGYIIVALIQSFAAFVIFSIFRVEGALALAVITFVVVFIPMVGGAVIYLPLSVARIAGGDVVGGIVLFAASAIFISGIDNLLRPFFLKDRIQLHPLIILLAILGGIIVFGFNGLILGPTLVILFLTVLDIFLAEHKIKKLEPKKQE